MTQQEHDDLLELLNKTDNFISEVFDWVSTLQHQHILGHLYDLKNSIQEKLKCQISDAS